jgi:polysaccharide biosynthesis transport protein
MSSILEARRKLGTQGGDLGFQLATLDGISLFPAPAPAQMGEFEQLASALISRHDGTTGQVITFASTVSGEGASYVSYNVARHMSYLLDRKVAWVDANFRSPQERLPRSGISFRGLLQSPGSFSELKTAGNLVAVPNGEERIKQTDLLTSANYVALLEHFQRNFFFTFIDAPPILDSGDVAHLAGPTLGLVLVVEVRRLKHEIIRHGLAKLSAHHVSILGTVLNKRTFDIPDFLYRRL